MKGTLRPEMVIRMEIGIVIGPCSYSKELFKKRRKVAFNFAQRNSSTMKT